METFRALLLASPFILDGSTSNGQIGLIRQAAQITLDGVKECTYEFTENDEGTVHCVSPVLPALFVLTDCSTAPKFDFIMEEWDSRIRVGSRILL